MTSLSVFKPAELFMAPTFGVRHVAVPAIRRLQASGVDAAVTVFCLNGAVTVLLASFLYSARLYDPRRTGRVSRFIKRGAENDPMAGLFMLLPKYKAISRPEIRPVFVSLLALPITGVVTLGLLAGVLFISFAAIKGGAGRFLVALGYIAPHGIIEAGAVMAGASIPISALISAGDDIARGDFAAVFDRIKEIGTDRKTFAVLGMSLIALAAAAVIEIHLTGTVGRLIETLV